MKSYQTLAIVLCFAFVTLACGVSAPAQSDPRQQAAGLEHAGDDAGAEALWHAYAEQHPADAEADAHVGQLAARQGHYAEAIAAYRRAMGIAPAMPGLRPNLGLAYFKNGDYREAIAMFAPMLKANPGDERLTLLVGMSHYGLAEYAAATPYLKRAADGDGQNLTLLLTLAHSCLYAREYQCVLDTFHRILALNAESAEAHMLVGEALDEMKDPMGAQREFRAAITVNPNEPNVHFGLGYLLWTQAQFPEAAKEFQAELVNNPQHVLARLYLADTDIKMDKVDDAIPLLAKLEKSTPENAMAHRDLGEAYEKLGHNQEAVTEFRAAIRLAPEDVNAHWRLGRLYRAMGRTDEANAEFKKSQSLNQAADERLVQIMSKIPRQDSANALSAPNSPTP
jgi:tetratricopeptide (TPR) repeat protein